MTAAETLLDPDRLGDWLTDRPALRDSLPIRSFQRIGLGQSNLTFLVELRDRSVVVRRPPPGPIPPRAHDVLREFRVMQALASSPVPVPTMLAACADPAVLGYPFFVMEALAGDAIRFELPPGLAQASRVVRRSIGEQAIDALAALHQVEPAAVGLHKLGQPSGYVARQLHRWRQQLDYARVRPVPDLDHVADWLVRHLPPEPATVRIVHGDYKLDNVIFSQEEPVRLLGVVDWEMATLGDPLADLGWFLAFWRDATDPPPDLPITPRVTELSGFPTRRELLARYEAKTGTPVPDLRFYLVFALWKMAVLLEGHWARHVRGTAGAFDYRYLETAGPRFQARVREATTLNGEQVLAATNTDGESREHWH